MKTKSEFIAEVSKSARRSFAFQVIAGILLPLALFYFPISVVGSIDSILLLGYFAFLSVMFIAYGCVLLWESRSKALEKAWKTAHDLNLEFVRMGYSREHFHKELAHLPDELKCVYATTTMYEELDNLKNAAAGCGLFGPVLFAVMGIGGLSEFNPSLWSHLNPYIAIVLLIIYAVVSIGMDFLRKQLWDNYFTSGECNVNLKESLPDIFGQYSLKEAIIEIRFTVPIGLNADAFAERVAEAYVADVKRRCDEADAEIREDAIVVTM